MSPSEGREEGAAEEKVKKYRKSERRQNFEGVLKEDKVSREESNLKEEEEKWFEKDYEEEEEAQEKR